MSIKNLKKCYISNKKIIQKMWVNGFVFILFVVIFFEFFKFNFAIWIDAQKEPCIPEYSVYLIKKKTKSFKKGDIVAFKTHGEIKFYDIETKFGKYVAATSGDVVLVNKNGVFVNDKLVATGFELIDKIGIKKQKLYRNYIIDNDSLFVLGKTANSYDSRYWGVIKKEQIIGKALPLW